MVKARESLIKMLDWGSWVTLIVTVILFVVALFQRGPAHNILLEAGVFLVSVKLVMSASKTYALLEHLREEIAALRKERSEV